ncbi:DUF1934 domain-containing protein [Aerococcaceae bacterium DSM 111020]|nr:DUF1934 domain-containing protein [Aerococcaceae bacterium DSM 111020]
MQRRQGQVIVNQRVNYIDTNQTEQYHVESMGEWIELHNYSRISYHDTDDNEIIVKWYETTSDDSIGIEIRQMNYTLVFVMDQPYIVSYPTPQGIWDLAVRTSHIQVIENDEQKVTIEIDYQMEMNDQPIANYEFRLIYQ